MNKAELLQVLKSMKNENSPGTNGFTSEFYKFFWVDIGNEVLKSWNEAFYTGELSTTQKQGIITLLPKIIHPENLFKKGFRKDRYIFKNIRTIFDSIQYAKIRKLMGMLLFIDFEKAFNSLEWDFSLMVLKA